MNPKYRIDETVRQWRLLELLGRGGNAEVWRATDNVREVAVKILFRTGPTSEPYRRFVREVEFMRSLGDRPGVLPLIDADLPDAPSKKAPAWLAMPVAIGVREALEGRGLGKVVEAFASYATTLAALAGEFDVAHRDLKPANLYGLDSGWSVGDFGLVELPSAEALTAEGRTVGPLYFLAPEVLSAQDDIDYQLADVWSLAKSLWVTAVEQQWPVMGEQPADREGQRIMDLSPHVKAAQLDRVIERCTTIDPRARPSMRELADELRAWSSEPVPAVLADIAEVGARLRERTSGEASLAQRRERQIAAASEVSDRLRRRLRPLHVALDEAYPRVEIEAYDQLAQNWLSWTQAAGRPSVLWSDIRADRVTTGPDYHPYVFRIAWSVELLDNGQLRLAGMIDYGFDGETGGDNILFEERLVPVESLAVEQNLDALANELIEALGPWLDRFVTSLPPSGI